MLGNGVWSSMNEWQKVATHPYLRVKVLTNQA